MFIFGGKTPLGGRTRAMPFGVACTALAVMFSAPSAASAITYTIENPVGSSGHLWLSSLPSQGPINVGGAAGSMTTDGTIGPLTAQNILSFQLGVNAGGWSADVSMPLPGTGAVFIQGSAFFATTTGLLFDFANTSASYVKFERDSTALGQADIFFCLNAGGADCGGATQFDVTAAVLFPSRPDWSAFDGRSRLDLANPFNRPDILSATGTLLLADAGALGVPGPSVGSGTSGFILAALLLCWLVRRPRHGAKAHQAGTCHPRGP